VDRRRFLKVVSASAAMGMSRTGRAAAEGRPPNIILVMADDCSAKEFSCYGNRETHTPRLDELGRTGVMFKTCWATPICSPTRAMIMTGRYAYRTGWYHNDMKPEKGEKGYDLAEDNLIFAQALKDAGYRTGICGKWQLRGSEETYGFEELCMHHAIKDVFDGPIEPEEGSLPGRPARYWHPAIVRDGKQMKTTDTDYGPDIYTDFIIDFARRHKDEPFMVYFPMSLTHSTWDFDLERMGYVAPPELDASGRKTGRKGEPSLKANVEYTDRLMGRLADAMDELGIRDNTVIMFTCDNGTSGYGKSKVSQERGPRVPLIVNCPGIVKRLGPCDALVDFSDIMPTMLDLAGVDLPTGYEIDGTSFAPVLRGEKKTARDWIFSNFAETRMIRDSRWLMDGQERLYDCGDQRNEEGYKDVTDSEDPEVAEVKRRFNTILEKIPAPDTAGRAYKAYMAKRKAKQQTLKGKGR
jgi:arylsulfatase A